MRFSLTTLGLVDTGRLPDGQTAPVLGAYLTVALPVSALNLIDWIGALVCPLGPTSVNVDSPPTPW